MDRRPSDKILDEWDAVAARATRPAEAPRRPRTSWAGGSLVGLAPLAAAAIVVAVGLTWLGGRESGLVGTNGSPTPSSIAVGASPSSQTSTIRPSPTAARRSAAPTASPATVGPAACGSDVLRAAIIRWEGAAGSRIATVQMTNGGTVPCTVPVLARPDLVDGTSTALAVGRTPTDRTRIEVPPGQVLTTLVQVSNVCVPRAVPPISVRFDFDGFSIVAAPFGPDAAAVPPCNGPGQPATIEMRPWSR
jgi:Protein of unknown function (DUF4232)